jgi:amino acid transporter
MAATTESVSHEHGEPSETHVLRRELKLTDAAAFSVGLIGPVGVMALLGAGATGILGRGAIWAFIFALVAVSLVAYAFVRLSRHISHTGSVYALVGVTLGPRAGFFAGWSLFGAYMIIGAGSAIEIGLFGGEFLRGVGIADTTEWIVIAGVALLVGAGLAFAQIHVITRSLLLSELVGALLVTVLSVVIIVRLAAGDAPHGQTLNADFLSLPSGTGIGTIASAAVFGFLAFAGFEGAATLGEETQSPRTQIPRAIKIAIAVVGAFYLLTMAAQTLGYGTDKAGIAAFQGADSPYGDLAKAYVGPVLADALNFAASLSLFAILLGTVAASARILFALARDSGGTRGVARLSSSGAPVVALTVVLLMTLGVMVGQRIAGSAVLDATFYALTIGTLALLVAYVMATVGAIKFLFLGPERRAPSWQVVVPVAAIGLVGYTMYKNVFGLAAPYDRFPYIVAAWLIIGLAIVMLSPNMASRVGIGLARSGEQEAAGPR